MHLSDIKYDRAMEKMKEIDKDLAVRKPESSYNTMHHKPSIYQGQEKLNKEFLRNVAKSFSSNIEHR